MPNTFLGMPPLVWLMICVALLMIVIIGIATTTPKRYTKTSWLREANRIKPHKSIQCFQCGAWVLAKNASRHLLTRCPHTPTEEKNSGEPLILTPDKTYRIDL